MFSSLSSFSIFFFTVATLLLAGIIFEEKFLSLEDKFDDYIKRKKQQKRAEKIRKYQFQKMQNEKRASVTKSNCARHKAPSRNFAA